MKIELPQDMRESRITCKGLYKQNRADKDDLGSFLNVLAIVYSEAAKSNEARGWFAIAKDCNRKADMFHKICDELGMYDNL